MTRNQRWVGQTVGVAILAAGLLATGCDARGGGEGNANSTVNLSSLPAAEAWVDGKAAGSTPLAVPLAPGRHELVFKQTGFAEHRQTLDVAAGAVASVDATLQPVDPMDPDALRLVAAAYGVTVEPFRAPEVHRGAASIGGAASPASAGVGPGRGGAAAEQTGATALSAGLVSASASRGTHTRRD